MPTEIKPTGVEQDTSPLVSPEADDGTCPFERIDPSPEVSFCSDEERLLKFVELSSHISHDELGLPHLLAIAIREDDLKKASRSVSTLRLPKTPAAEIIRRGLVINKEDRWANDPLAATAAVIVLRGIKDASGRREICVFAEPTTAEQDKLGACHTHAGLKRSSNPPSSRSRLQWAVLRGEVAIRFDEFTHICSQFGDDARIADEAPVQQQDSTNSESPHWV